MLGHEEKCDCAVCDDVAANKKQRFEVRVSIETDLIVMARSHEEAVAGIPCNAYAHSVRIEGEPDDSRLIVTYWCCFCGKPILSNTDATYYTGVGVPLEMVPAADRYPFSGEDREVCCQVCALQKGLLINAGSEAGTDTALRLN